MLTAESEGVSWVREAPAELEQHQSIHAQALESHLLGLLTSLESMGLLTSLESIFGIHGPAEEFAMGLLTSLDHGACGLSCDLLWHTQRK